MLSLALLLVPVLVLVAIHRLQKRFYLTQYLFFIRFQILEAATLAIVPLTAPRVAPALLANLFVVDAVGMAVATMVGTLCAWSIVYTARLTWRSTPFRAGLPLRRVDASSEEEIGRASGPKEQGAAEFTDPGWDQNPVRWLTASLLLVVPLAAELIRASRLPATVTALSIGVGLLTAALVRESSVRGPSWPGEVAVWIGTQILRIPLLGAVIGAVLAAYRDAPAPQAALYGRLHWRAFLFGSTAALTYLTIGAVGWVAGAAWVPALVYVLAWFLVLVWILGFLAFQFDKTRIPGVPLAFLGVVLWQSVIPSHYEYRVLERALPEGTAGASLHARQDTSGTMVLFAAHGGGIKASLWTAQVASGLEGEIPGFHERVGLVSGVSGGAVGATFYVDAFIESGIDRSRLDSLPAIASTSSLAATTWGLVYLDFFRLAVGSLLNPRDRGWALERRWGELLSAPDRTLGDWADGVREGWRPMMIYNVTLQETGSRLLLAPVRLEAGPAGSQRDLFQYLPGRDLRVVTAARLSATFPWVSPQSRPALGADTSRARLHSADGGYFDNSGVLSALEVAGSWLRADSARTVQRVALVEAQASGPPPAVEGARGDKGDLINALLGPIRTLYNVRTASQIARRESDADLVASVWGDAYDVELCRFVFSLTEGLPLSWHLSEGERERIEAHWPSPGGAPEAPDEVLEARTGNRREVEALKSFLSGGSCPSRSPTGG